MFCSGLAFHSWQSPGTHEECIRKAKALRLPTLRELIDLKWDSDSERAFFRSRCQRGTAVFAVRCPFYGTQEKCEPGENAFGWHEVKCSAERLGRAACDSEFANSLLESGSLHSKTRRRPIQARHNPVALVQRFQDLLTF